VPPTCSGPSPRTYGYCLERVFDGVRSKKKPFQRLQLTRLRAAEVVPLFLLQVNGQLFSGPAKFSLPGQTACASHCAQILCPILP